MGDADKYESDESETSTASTAAGTKYYQVSIPNYYLVLSDGTKSDTATGSSFLRLGSFPTGTSDTSVPAGYTSSYNLAKLVGDKTSILAAETKQDLNPSATANAIKPSYNGDPYYLLGFADDTRYRKGEDTGTATTAWTGRRDETTRLLTKGGWWDHSDGNRISTTAGDKIDIIQGNYKMVVLGRVPPSTALSTLAGGALITDISGGLMEENGPSPTHCIKSIEYILDESLDTWEVYQNNGIGKVYSSYYGDTVDIFLGQNKATWTGPVPSGYSVEDDAVTGVYNVYQKSLAIRKQLGEILDAGSPNVIDHVWAAKLLAYKGSSDARISTIVDKTYADSVTTKVDVTNKLDATVQGGAIQTNTIADTITSLQTAKAITQVNTAANNFNFTIGLQENINVGLILNLYANAVLSVGLNATSVNGINNTYDGTKLNASLSEQALNGLVTLVAAHSSCITTSQTDVGADLIAIRADEVVVGDIMNDFRAAKFF